MLPLHIFEDRYKEMIGEAIRDQSEFGVVLANENGVVNQGCTATVDRVLKQYPDGRMDIVTIGRRRFEILLLNEERSFLRASVDFFDDDEGEPAPPGTLERAIEAYNRLLALEKHPPLDRASATERYISFRLAQPVNDLRFRQSILTARSEAERLRRLAEFLPEFVAKQARVQHIKDVAPRNGHGHHTDRE
jgi:Lon protease-like protein